MLFRRPSSSPVAVQGRPDSQDAGPYLERYGYTAADASTWSKTNNVRDWPVIHVAIPGHEEVDKHTYYFIDCSLSSPRIDLAPLKWRSRRRLCQLREELHDPLKAELKNEAFKKLIPAPFASRGGMPGTTACLNTWCISLAKAINSGGLPPPLTALVLQFVEAPDWPALMSSGTEIGAVDVRIDQDNEARSQTSSLDVLTGDAEASAEDDLGIERVPSAPGSDYGHPAPRAVSRRNPESSSEDEQEPAIGTWNGEVEAFEGGDASVEQAGAEPAPVAADFGLDERPPSEATSPSASSEDQLRVFDLVESSRPSESKVSQNLHDLLDPASATTASGNEGAKEVQKEEEERLAEDEADAAQSAAAPVEAQRVEEECVEQEGAEATETATPSVAAEAQAAAQERLAHEAAEAAKKVEEEKRVARVAAEAEEARRAEEARCAEEERLAREASEATQRAEEERLEREAAEATQAAAVAAAAAQEAAEEAKKAEQEERAREAAEAKQAAAAAEAQFAEEERLGQEAAEVAKKAEEVRIVQEAAEAAQAAAAAEAQRAAEERLAQEAAEVAKKAEEERIVQEAVEAAEAAAAAEAKRAEEERICQEAAETAQAAAQAKDCLAQDVAEASKADTLDSQCSAEERLTQDTAGASQAAVAAGTEQPVEEECPAQAASQAAVQDEAACYFDTAQEAALESSNSAALPEEVPSTTRDTLKGPQESMSRVARAFPEASEDSEHTLEAAPVTQATVEAAPPTSKDEDSDDEF